nr:heme utilization protein [Ideonella sp.]
FETADLRALASASVQALATAQVEALTTAQTAALTTQQIASLRTAQLEAFSTDDIVALTTAQVQALSTSQIASLTTTQFASMATDDIVALTTAQARALTTDQIVAFTTEQIVALETRDIASMTMTQISSFATEDIAVMTAAQVDAMIAATPIVLDLDGDGIRTLAAAEGVNFDIDGDGQAEKVGWVGSGDALLVRDRNADGTINDGTELYGGATRLADGTRAGHGYNALAQEDTNQDGRIDANDAHFHELRLWTDADRDGLTDEGELRGLVDLGVVSLDLSAVVGTQMDNGNLLGLVSSYTTASGETRDMADVWFAKDVPPVALDELLASPAAEVLPAAPTAPAGTAAPAAPVSQNPLGDDDLRNQGPLI